jgi:hypothetical protein
MALLSVKPIIDRFTVVDHGSEDGSRDAAVQMLYGIPGRFYESDKYITLLL